MTKFNAAFYAWFGDSKVVDAEGRPRVMYHGTAIGDIAKFSGIRDGIAGHFAFSPKYAAGYAASAAERERDIGDELSKDAGEQIYPVYLRAENIFDPRKRNRRAKAGLDEVALDYMDLEAHVDEMVAAGFDAYLDFEPWHGNKPIGIAVFSPTQIKSATGNRGTWSPTDPDIRHNPETYWGRAGSGILFTCKDLVFLTLRSASVEQPHTWGIPGGSCSGEAMCSALGERTEPDTAKARESAANEVREELGCLPKGEELGRAIYRDRGFTYTTFLVELSQHEARRLVSSMKLNWENDEASWFSRQEALALPNLHFGARYVLERLP